MLFYFFVNIYSVSWLAFDTEKKLISACNLCQMEIDIMEKNFSYFNQPIANSSCSKNNKINIYCNLIHDIHEDIISRYEEKIPSDYCSIHGPCIFEPPSDLIGVNCAHCLNIISYVFEAEEQERKSTLNNFCSSTFGSAIQFCNGVTYIISKSMKSQFSKYHSATDFCTEAAFCTYNGIGKLKSLKQKRSEL